MKKICGRCKIEKSLDEFYLWKKFYKYRTKRTSWCKDCYKKWYMRQWYLKRRILKGCRFGSTNNQWKGNEAGYISLHEWVRRHKPKTTKCQYCGKKKLLELANISGKYKRNVNDYKWLCRRCHMTKDGRIKKQCP